nr:hypothetical protein [Streptomyces noursei]
MTSSAGHCTTEKSTVACSGGSTSWKGSPSTAGYTVRNASCRATTSPTADRNATTSTAPSTRKANGALYVGLCSKRSKNHSRCCADDNGSASGRGRGSTAGRAATPSVVRADSRSVRRATVGAPNSSRIPSCTPSTERIRLRSWAALREWPPRAKKLSSGATLGTPSVCANRPHSNSSCTDRGLCDWLMTLP